MKGFAEGGGAARYLSKVSRFRSDQESQILNKTVSPILAPRLRQSKTFDHYEDLDQCIHVQVRSILSFMQSLTLIEEHNIIILLLYFLPYTLNFQSTVQNVATVFQSYNGRDWLPERGIVHLNASPECIISYPGTDQNSSLLHVIKLY